MSGKSKIEWTDRTWNPLTGCTKVSPGCDRCYAKTMHERFNGPGSFDTVTLHPERLEQPLRWRRPSRVFVNSMSDLFHRDVTDYFIAEVFAVMAAADRHTFQLLTKRPARMRSLLAKESFWLDVFMIAENQHGGSRRIWPLPNVWLGVSVEDQHWADLRIPALLDTPAAVRFLSCEPLLGPINLRAIGATGWHLNTSAFRSRDVPDRGIDWVIVGGESGRGARLMHAGWARTLRDQCEAAGVPFLFKQWGEWAPTKHLSAGLVVDPRERPGEAVADGLHAGDAPWRRVYRRVGKKAAGRELDGRTWDEYPAVVV
jgi:protein gp37